MKSRVLCLFALVSAAVAQSTSSPCYDGVRVILARGTGEPQNSSVSELVAKSILAAIPDSYSTEVIYPASSDPNGVSVGAADAQRQIYDYARACPTGKIVLTGYSQGAVVIGNAIAGAGPVCSEVAKNIVVVVLYGDPGRTLGVGVDSDVNDKRTFRPVLDHPSTYEDRLSEWCNYDDFVCCATGTTFAAHLSYWTNENADTIASYVSSKAAGTTLTSATLGSTCTAASAATRATSTAAVKPSGSAAASASGSIVSGGSYGNSSSASVTQITSTPLVPTGAGGPATSSPGIATQTTNVAVKKQAGIVGGAVFAFIGALVL